MQNGHIVRVSQNTLTNKVKFRNNENHRPNLKNQGNCLVYIGADAAGDGLYPSVQDPHVRHCRCRRRNQGDAWRYPRAQVD